MQYKPYEYQRHAKRHIIDNPGSGLFLEMGLGKTVVTLTAIRDLIRDGEVKKVLVIAPKRVAEDTWTTEAGKWDHLRHLRIAVVLGSAKRRLRALRSKADIYVINRENVAWLVGQYDSRFPFDMMVIDELSSFKSAQAVRFKALRLIRPKVGRVVGLTGTPAPNGLLDLWPQLYLLDMGERLGKTIGSYREKYFVPGKRNGHIVYEYHEKADDTGGLLGKNIYKKEIYDKISDICISMKSKDYLDLPGRINCAVNVTLSKKQFDQYIDFEKRQILELEDADDISAVNAAALTTKLLQYANGAIYDVRRDWHEVHDQKLDALEEIVDVTAGPMLVFYSYKHDLERIQERLKGKTRQLKTSKDISDWNKGKIPVLLAHPGSAGHGLNLQAGGNTIIWFGLPWSLELYQQANARLDRQGQENVVIIHHLIAKDTIDEDVWAALENKKNGQEALMSAVKARVKKYLG